MARIVLYLARHGETDANANGVMQGSLINLPLNERGRQQAALLAAEMSSKQLDWIVSSEMDRAVQTADAVAQLCPGVPVSREQRLHEVSSGILDGKLVKDCRHLVRQVDLEWRMGNLDAKVSGGESANEISVRLLAAFADILDEARRRHYQRVFVCSHGGALRSIMALLVNKDIRTLGMFPHRNCCYHCVAVEMDDGGGDKVTVDPLELTFEALDICKTEHLGFSTKVTQ
ncbi:hypothetical protein LPJ56_000365 [Coemansia sp. RSA 2599]|nr:hypothetical protein LPJ75_000121 [Coemansia sp. RSA 2598]KAJ1829423.1 hypothetical protein LPJ56_000365 [Coemansia sp. RSA 2599]